LVLFSAIPAITPLPRLLTRTPRVSLDSLLSPVLIVPTFAATLHAQ
jgi:hypothetical protein